MPERALCTDNAAMIASAARFGERLEYPRLPRARRLRQRRAALGARDGAVTVYSKPDCHLCEQAMEALRALQPELAFDSRSGTYAARRASTAPISSGSP